MIMMCYLYTISLFISSSGATNSSNVNVRITSIPAVETTQQKIIYSICIDLHAKWHNKDDTLIATDIVVIFIAYKYIKALG